MKQLNKKKSFFNNIIFNNIVILIIIGIILYKLLPYALNYPPNSIDNQFQIDLVGLKYTEQYIILISSLIFIVFLVLKFTFKKILTNINNNSADIDNIRKKCFNYPYLLLIFEVFCPSILATLLLLLFKTDFELLTRLLTLIFSFSTLFAIASYMVNKRFFVDKLIYTSSISNSMSNSKKINIPIKLLLQILPLFLYSFVILLLLTTTIITKEKGNLLYEFYQKNLLSTFDVDTTYTLSEIQEQLCDMPLENTKDYGFIFSASTGTVYYSPEPLDDFLISYTQNFYEKTNGHSYDYYGQNTSESIIKLKTPYGEYFVGIKYYIINSSLMIPFILTVTLLLLFNILFILYIGLDLRKDIKRVSLSLNNIVHANDITNSKNLSVTSSDEIGDLTLAFNDVQNLTKKYIHQLQNNQDQLIEQERLASLGQMIGGIAHNLKTPIMSISGATEGLKDLTTELDNSIGNPVVTANDYHEIAQDMNQWIDKIRSYTEYMSDIITAVKGQAVVLNNELDMHFTINELLKKVNILMKHELKTAVIYLNTHVKIDENIILSGDVNSLVQVVNNMITNAIHAYNGEKEKSIDLIVDLYDEEHIAISIKDYGPGLPDIVKEKLFKEMITTKGKHGTGLGLYMSYSNIKAYFNGTITFNSEKNKGTTFNIILPL